MKYVNTSFDFDKLDANDIDRIQLSMIRPHSRVLEVGCANGFMSEYMKNALGCTVVGLELDNEAAARAEEHCSEVIQGSIEDPLCRSALVDWVKASGEFDIILMSQVIEHVADYQGALVFLKSLLDRGGELVISTVNIAHWTSRLRLLFGIWRYEAYGLFDEQHLRFFTLSSLRSALDEAGFEILEADYSVIDFNPFIKVSALQFFNLYSMLKRLPFVGSVVATSYKRLLKNLIAWQFVYRARPKRLGNTRP